MSADRLIVVEPGLVAVDPERVVAVVSIADAQTELILSSGQAIEVGRGVDDVLRILRGEPVADKEAHEEALEKGHEQKGGEP